MRARSEPLLLAVTATIALVAGLVSRNWLLAVTVALALHLARQTWIAHTLAQMLRTERRLEPPFPGGVWQDIFGVVRGLQSRSRKRKRRLSRFVSRFREAAAALPDAVVILRKDQRIQWCNPAARKLLNLPRHGGPGPPITEHVRDPVFDEYLAAEDPSRPLVIPAPGNRSIMLSVLVTPFGGRQQRILVGRDVTRTYHLDRAQRDFVANVSHELRTPLTVLSGNLEILSETTPYDGTSHQAFQSMRGNVERMGVLVNELLALSRLEMSQQSRSEEVVNVPAILGSVVTDARMLAAASQHVVDLDAEPGLMLLGSESELRSVFSNLVHNAIRHTPTRSTIRVSWSCSGDGARLSVKDNGPGIARRHIPRLTERFYRVDESRSTRTGGTGLGLSIVKLVLDRHDASLSIESREGAGSSFHCDFPGARVCKGIGERRVQPAESARID